MNGVHRMTERTQNRLDKVSTLSCRNYLPLCAISENITMFISQFLLYLLYLYFSRESSLRPMSLFQGALHIRFIE
jgi:hypothetical protein